MGNDTPKQSMGFCLAENSHEAIGEDTGYEVHPIGDSSNVICQGSGG